MQHQPSRVVLPLRVLAGFGLALALALPTIASASWQPFKSGYALFAPQLEGRLNINTATESEWELLPGIGPSTAKKIVAYRAKYPFKEVSHVMRIKGIGRKTFEVIRPFLVTQGATTLQATGKTKDKTKSKAKDKAPVKPTS